MREREFNYHGLSACPACLTLPYPTTSADLPSQTIPLSPPTSHFRSVCLCEACHHRQSPPPPTIPTNSPSQTPIHTPPPCRRSRRPSRSSNPTTAALPPKTAPAAPSRAMPKVASARRPPVYPDYLSMEVAQGSTRLGALPAALLTASASLSTTRELQLCQTTAATVILSTAGIIAPPLTVTALVPLTARWAF